MNVPFDLVQRMISVCVATRQNLTSQLGAGKDGSVFATSHGTAIKFHSHPTVYRNERDAYLRLKEKRVTNVNGFNVPKLLSFHDAANAVEMSIVQPPYLLDFASARIDEDGFAFDSDTEEFRHANIHELFGDRAADVFLLLDTLQRRFGILMLDARPPNIRFE